MKQIVHWGLLAMMVVTLAALGPALAKSPPPPDYFPLHVNDWWKYKWTANGKSADFTLKVIKAEGDLFLMETTSTQVIHDWYAKPAGWVEMRKIEYPSSKMTAEYKPAKKYLQNPLTAGATWSWKGTGMMDTEIEEHNKVTGSETVTVPAGKFAAMHVDTDVVQGGSNVKKSYWFADHIGMVKSMTSTNGVDSTAELVDYSFKKK